MHSEDGGINLSRLFELATGHPLLGSCLNFGASISGFAGRENVVTVRMRGPEC